MRAYQEECSQEESRYHYLHCMMQMVEIQQKKVADEMKAYTSADPYARKKTFRYISLLFLSPTSLFIPLCPLSFFPSLALCISLYPPLHPCFMLIIHPSADHTMMLFKTLSPEDIKKTTICTICTLYNIFTSLLSCVY